MLCEVYHFSGRVLDTNSLFHWTWIQPKRSRNDIDDICVCWGSWVVPDWTSWGQWENGIANSSYNFVAFILKAMWKCVGTALTTSCICCWCDCTNEWAKYQTARQGGSFHKKVAVSFKTKFNKSRFRSSLSGDHVSAVLHILTSDIKPDSNAFV